jgi:hypothetical protein
LNQGDWIKVANVQFEEGSVATEFEYVPYEIQLQRCMRYYEKSYDVDTLPGSVTFLGAYGFDTSGMNNSCILFRVKKRSIPSVILFSPKTGASNMVYYQNTITNNPSGDISCNIYYISESGFHIECNPGDQYYVLLHFIADAEL